MYAKDYIQQLEKSTHMLQKSYWMTVCNVCDIWDFGTLGFITLKLIERVMAPLQQTTFVKNVENGEKCLDCSRGLPKTLQKKEKWLQRSHFSFLPNAFRSRLLQMHEKSVL